MTKHSNLKRTFTQWQADFRSEAQADGYNEFRRHLEYLEMDFPPQTLLEGTELLLAAVMAYRTFDGQESDEFLRQQRYRLSGVGLPCYCLTFQLGTRGVGRVLTDEKFTGIDFADLYGHPWDQYKAVGYGLVWISRLDGNPISATELEVMDQRIMGDLFFDYSEDELDVSLDMMHVEDSVRLSVQDHCEGNA